MFIKHGKTSDTAEERLTNSFLNELRNNANVDAVRHDGEGRFPYELTLDLNKYTDLDDRHDIFKKLVKNSGPYRYNGTSYAPRVETYRIQDNRVRFDCYAVVGEE